MKAMNQEAMDLENNKGGSEVFRMYEVGRSQTALMLVRSMGIDPSTGNEVYIKRNGALLLNMIRMIKWRWEIPTRNYKDMLTVT